jgi:C4-dicarboxylate-binding protein DctP
LLAGMSANTRLRKPGDFKGLKMRTLEAIPVQMAFSEVFKALQPGTVDGTENPASNLYSRKMHEVQKYVTVSNHGYLGYAVLPTKILGSPAG